MAIVCDRFYSDPKCFSVWFDITCLAPIESGHFDTRVVGLVEKAELEQFRIRLLRLRSELQGLDEASKEAVKPVELDQASVGRLSRMDAMQAQQMAQEVVRRRQHQLVRVEGALRRIESGEYGCCFVCGEEIGVRRLEVDPTSVRCVKCVE